VAQAGKQIIDLIGNVTRDAETKAIPSGDTVTSFSVAVNDRDNKATFYNCSLFGKRGEAVAPYLTKGTKVNVLGTLNLREYTGRDGTNKTSPDVRVSELYLLGSKPEGATVAPRANPLPSEDDSDLPF
jgi:single-strand DNA-binding protein